MALAVALTVVAGLAFGAYRLFGADSGSSGSGSGASAAPGDVPATIDHSIGAAFGAIGTGLGMRNLADQYHVRDAIDVSIFVVGQDRVQLQTARKGLSGAQADAVDAALAAEDRLGAGLVQWRDALFNLRFGQVDPAQNAVNDAITALAAARDSWNAATS